MEILFDGLDAIKIESGESIGVLDIVNLLDKMLLETSPIKVHVTRMVERRDEKHKM